MTTPRMADSVTPWLIPETFNLNPNGVLAYADGAYEWTPGMVAQWRRKRFIRVSITGATDTQLGEGAWELDVERFDATPGDAVRFAGARLAAGKRACIYSDRSTVPAVRDALGDKFDEVDLHVATLDGRLWTPAELAADISQLEGVTVAASQIWAIQYLPAGHYDVSLVYGTPAWDQQP